jgi:hypothetical protein
MPVDARNRRLLGVVAREGGITNQESAAGLVALLLAEAVDPAGRSP